MKTSSRALRVLVVVAGCFCVPTVTHGALAKAAGGSGYSGTLSTNRAVRQQQLICDPPEPIRGSTSVLYEANKVSLDGFAYGPGYREIEVVAGSVEVLVNDRPVLQDLFSFLNQPLGRETGYVQVFFRLAGQAGQITPTGIVVDEDPGPGQLGEGVDTHQFFFNELQSPGGPQPQGVFPPVVATYVIYADEGNRPSRNQRDFLVGLNDAGAEFEFGPDQLQRAIVTSPEPSAFAVLALAGVAMLRRRTR